MATMTTPMNGRKAVGISFATQYVELGIQFVSVMALARILSPSEIGTFSVAAMLMSMLHVFRDFGVTQYVIQERELTREKLQGVMGVAILLALAVAALLAALSGPAARFYDNPALRELLLVMSASFAISPFGSVLLGVLRRETRLEAIFWIKTSSALCHVAVAISLALAGYGALSLAWANFAGILAFGLAGNLFRPAHMPWGPRLRNIRAILSFGSISSLGNLANNVSASAPELIVGKVMNMAAVGYFSRANGLVQLFTRLIGNAVTPLVLPYFAQVKREGKPLTQPYLQAVAQITAVAWPFLAVLLVLAYPVTHALYGAQWDASVPVAQVLCVAGAIAAIGLFSSQAMIAAGQVRSATLCTLLVQPVRVVAVLAVSKHGLLAVALALVASECVALAGVCWFLRRTIGVGPLALARACAASAVITLCALAAPVLLWLAGFDFKTEVWTTLILGGLGAAIGWLGGLALTGHPLAAHVLPLLKLGAGTSPRAAAAGGQAPLSPAARARLLAYRSGALGAWHRIRNRRNLTVVMFHRVLPRSDPRYPGADPEWTMTPESFAQCLEFFRRHYRVVDAATVFAALEGKAALPPNSLLITFDDGWADTAEFAQPVLERYRMPSLVFVAGGAIGQVDPFWEEALYSFLASEADAPARLEAALAGLGMAPLASQPQAGAGEPGIRAVIRELGQRPREQALALAAELRRQSGKDGGLPAMMDVAQLRRLAEGHAIGGHGMVHQPLTRVPDLAAELRAAQASVAGYLGQDKVASMSLPHGAGSAEVLAACRQAGYRYLFDSRAHLNRIEGEAAPGQDIGAVGRIHISERQISDACGRVEPTLLATWLFLRPVRALERPGSRGH